MNLPPPARRKCDECMNSMTLNLFKLNSTICRFCQDGLPVPIRLQTKEQEDPKKSSPDISPTTISLGSGRTNTDSIDNQVESKMNSEVHDEITQESNDELTQESNDELVD